MGYSGDGSWAIQAELSSPFFISYDPSGGLLIPDSFNFRVRRVDLSTGIITTIAGNGIEGYSGDGGLATSASLANPTHALYAPDGSLYIADSYNFVVRKVDSLGYISTIVGTGG